MRKAKNIRIIMAEDHASMRESFETYFKTIPGIKFIAGVANGLELFQALKRHKADLVLLDLEMPIMNGLVALPKLREEYPNIKVIVLTTHVDPSILVQLMNLGANAYLTKHSNLSDIVVSIHRVMEEGFWMEEGVARRVVAGFIEEIGPFVKYPLDLNEKEKEVLQEYCSGYGYNEIAERLHISRNTVKYHLRRIYQKTEAGDVRQLVKYAIKNGITGLE